MRRMRLAGRAGQLPPRIPVQGGQRGPVGVVAEEHVSPPPSRGARQQVDPGDGVGVPVLGLAQEPAGLSQVPGAHAEVVDEGGGHRRQPQGDGVDQAGQPHAPQGRPEQVGEPGPRAAHHVAAGQHHLQLVDEGPEGADAVVVLAVDVGGDAAAQGAVPGPGGDRREPAPGEGEADHVVEGGPGLGLQDPAPAVEVQQVPQGEGRDHVAGEGRVPVAAPGAAADAGAARAGEPPQIVEVAGAVHGAVEAWVAPPAVQWFGLHAGLVPGAGWIPQASLGNPAPLSWQGAR